MTKLLLLILVSLLITLQPARSEILVYSGTLRRTEPEESYRPYTLKCFLVTDPTTGQIVIIGYGRIKGIKKVDLSSVTTALYSPLQRLDNLTFELYSYTVAEIDFPTSQRSIFLRGPQKTVTVTRNLGLPVQAQRARTLKGSTRTFGTGFGYFYLENEIAVRLNEVRTVDVNVRGLTIAQVRDELNSYLSSLGFTF